MKWTTKDLVYMALYAALFIVLDVAVNTLGILQMPNGGSLGVSVIPLLMASYHLGWQKGTVVAVLSILLQYVTGPMYTPAFCSTISSPFPFTDWRVCFLTTNGFTPAC